MLTREIMGLLALGILWVNTLVVVAAAFGPLRALWGRLRRAKTHLRHGRARVEDGGALAEHRIDQVGRRASDDASRRAILFHDRSSESRSLAGKLETDGEAVEIPALSDEACEVWIDLETQRQAAQQGMEERFEEAYRAASKAKGFRRMLVTAIRHGEETWLVEGEGKLLIASFDPRPWLRKKIALVLAFQLAMLVGSAIVTALVLTPPLFGTVSILGAALGLAFFLGVLQPGGVALRDAVRVPSRAFLRGSWVLHGSEGAGGPARKAEVGA